jgi:protein-S-isoprenylcysteine O-methyltransferase Ste14
MSRTTLARQTAGTFVLGAIVLGVLLFLPAWTLEYWQAWVFIVVFTTATNAIGVYLALTDPALLERRKRVGPAAEQRLSQRIIISLGILSYLGVMVFSALDHRFGWSPVPPFVAVLGDALVALGLFINLLVFRENTYGASNIRVEESQHVISTGPYAILRHPMYAGVLVLVLGTPLALGSSWGLLVLALALPMLIWRILDEEKLLEKDLPRYTDYAHHVRYRLVPLIW